MSYQYFNTIASFEKQTSINSLAIQLHSFVQLINEVGCRLS